VSVPVPLALRSRSFRADRVAWIVFLLALLAGTAATKAWFHRRVWSEASSAAALTRDYRLPVLAYDRVGRGGESLDPERLQEHLLALRDAGFHPVSLRQVRDAYRQGAPLPLRPILLTFDGGHLSTYQAVDPLLRRLGWPAVMFVDPRLQEDRHATYVYWDRLQRMVDSGLWDVGVVGPWSDGARLLERHLPKYRVLGRARRGGEAEPAGGVGPQVTFENASFGVNDPAADPGRLFRLRVPTAWSGRELVDRLGSSLATPELQAPGEPPAVGPHGWACSAGSLEMSGDTVRLAGAPRGEVWLAGAEWAHDFVLEAQVRPDRGVFWIVQQAVGSGEQWRWGGTQRILYLQRIRPGARIEVISRADIASSPGAWHTVRVVKRGEGVWVEWDGARVGDLPRPVAARWRGQVGFSTGSPGQPGRVELRGVRFAAIPYQLRVVSASPPPSEIRSLLGDVARVAALSPPGLVQEGTTLARQPVDRDLLAMVAARGAWELIPTVELRGPAAPMEAGRAAAIADIAAREGWAGVRVVGRDVAPAARTAWLEAASAWARIFHERGLRLVWEPVREGTP
jgi:Polysaccharide deacetylase